MLPILSYLALALTLTLFPCLACCDAEFVRPPEIEPTREHDWDYANNVRYIIGDEIQISWKSDIPGTELWLVQLKDTSSQGVEWMLLDASRTEWEVEYNVGGLSKNEEDSVYAFALWISRSGVLAQSLFFNVSAPDPETTTTISKVISITRTTTQSIAESTTQSEPSKTGETTTTSTTTIAEEDTGATPKSGLSKGETAGAAVGGTIGGLLIFGCVGWLLWKQTSKKKRDPSIYEAPAGQLSVSEPKAELPGDHGSHIPGYARSPPGVFEAP
ncbi:hypothetical protein HYE67_009644 [Fusarium culmorum]|uniref:Mid2 domain-containing protein n=1 Tax=Fusarium culmorum TaxID=5516 RepID=A0A2T4H9R6_FUSCU|nr:hypothetical protein FCULG_00004570 [Fusarium culmorum]QPC67413.1 hypothetical protein HYE67_009644 [Fusarium culmorum]